MKLAGIFLLFFLALAGCRSTPPELPTTDPSLTGTITGIESQKRNSAVVLVEDSAAGGERSAKTLVNVSEQAKVFRRLGTLRMAAGDLRTGQRVSVWFSGGVLAESDPPEAAAMTVVIDADGPLIAEGEATAGRESAPREEAPRSGTREERQTENEGSPAARGGPAAGRDSVPADSGNAGPPAETPPESPADTGSASGAGQSPPPDQNPPPPSGVAVLTAVRQAVHGAYDRVVFEFAGSDLPPYHVGYIQAPVRECASGEATSVAGSAWLEIRFEPAQAHTDSGEPTIAGRDRRPGFANIQQIRLTCDFEGHVTWVIGVAAPNRYQIAELSSPARLIIDVPN